MVRSGGKSKTGWTCSKQEGFPTRFTYFYINITSALALRIDSVPYYRLFELQIQPQNHVIKSASMFCNSPQIRFWVFTFAVASLKSKCCFPKSNWTSLLHLTQYNHLYLLHAHKKTKQLDLQNIMDIFLYLKLKISVCKKLPKMSNV